MQLLFQNVINFRRMNTVMAILITMGQVRVSKVSEKNRPIILCIRAYRVLNGLEIMGVISLRYFLYIYFMSGEKYIYFFSSTTSSSKVDG